jgi:hypothetical protein
MSRSFLATILLSLITVLSTTTSADTPDCPYPCLPPPTSGGSINSYPPPPPSTTGGSGGDFGASYPPPPPGSYQLTPPGAIPGSLAPPYSGYPSGPVPPPPNPVLPWYPWYYVGGGVLAGCQQEVVEDHGRGAFLSAVAAAFSSVVDRESRPVGWRVN